MSSRRALDLCDRCKKSLSPPSDQHRTARRTDKDEGSQPSRVKTVLGRTPAQLWSNQRTRTCTRLKARHKSTGIMAGVVRTPAVSRAAAPQRHAARRSSAGPRRPSPVRNNQKSAKIALCVHLHATTVCITCMCSWRWQGMRAPELAFHAACCCYILLGQGRDNRPVGAYSVLHGAPQLQLHQS